MNINIKKCARCGMNHDNIEVFSFTDPIIVNDEFTFAFYCFCPDNGEPILVQIINTPTLKGQA